MSLDYLDLRLSKSPWQVADLPFLLEARTKKSPIQAAVVSYRNRNSRGQIITVEDPVGFIHKHDRCIVTQRESGLDRELKQIVKLYPKGTQEHLHMNLAMNL